MAPLKYRKPPSPSSEICSECHESDFVLRQEGPHIARRCRRCQKWLGWVKRTRENLAACERDNAATPRKEPTQRPLSLVEPKRYPPVGEQIRPSFDPQVDTEGAKPADCVCRADVAKLKRAVEAIDRQLMLFTRIILAQGVLQGTQRPEIPIDDELLNGLKRNLAEGEAAR